MSRRFAGPALVVALVTAFVSLGIWQTVRWLDKRAHNALLVARTAMPPLDNGELLASAPPPYRRAHVTGTYDVEREFLLLSRAHEGVSGHHVITPLLLGDDAAVLVDRGWVPQGSLTQPSERAAPPPIRVVVEGVLVPDQTDGRYGPRPPSQPPDPGTFRIDTTLLRAHFPYRLVSGYVQLQSQQPAQDGTPAPVPFPQPADGPHLVYLIQWFLFAIATVTIALARARGRAPAQVH